MRIKWIVIIPAVVAVTLMTGAGATAPTVAHAQRVVVVDAGHGGAAAGVTGEAGLSEKRLTHDLAQRIATRLRNRYRVVFTRTSDVNVDIEDRTGVANNEKANAFISLHAGGSVDRTVEGVTLFHYTAGFSDVTDPPPPAKLTDTVPAATQPWQRVQVAHRAASSVLAHRIKTRLEAPPAPSSAVSVIDAPVRVLMGADMPAVVIEVGYLTNPLEEKRLMDDDHRASLARRIAQGIDDFFNTRDMISSTNLNE